MTTLAVAILAGGSSRRMGRDKALLPINGIPCLVRVMHAAAAWPILVIGHKTPPQCPFPDVRFIDDEYPGAGPMGGLLTAFRHHDGPVLVLPCDIPDVRSEHLQQLTQAWTTRRAPAVIATHDGHLNPLIGIYGHDCTAAIMDAFTAGERSLRRMVAILGAHAVDLSDALSLADVDTPADLAQRDRRQNAYWV